MPIEVRINGSESPDARYLGWAPSPAELRATGEAADLDVQLSTGANSVGQLVFFAAHDGASSPTLDLTVKADGSPTRFWVAGQFGHPSKSDRDTRLSIASAGNELASTPVMVRIRKNADKLEPDERDRFLEAFARFNNHGQGGFKAFRDMHTSDSNRDAHGGPGFLPWHRAYLLDLERELQAIDPSVALPYWRFDEAAPRLFTREFVGVTTGVFSRRVRFSAQNPLQTWSTDGTVGILRRPDFNPQTGWANVRTENQTLRLGGQQNRFAPFAGQMIGNPHGWAHSSFSGSISSIHTAAKDPLFFMLHGNVDRLWAKWQWLYKRFDIADPDAFATGPNGGPSTPGHNLTDTMWPWNGVTGGWRPPTAPGGTFATSPTADAPGPQPLVASTLDYQGRIAFENRLGFDYDDVPFE